MRPASSVSRRALFFSQLSVRLGLLILLVLLPALLLALVTTAEQNQNSINAVRQQALLLTELTAANNEQLVRGAEQVLTALSQNPDVKAGNVEACNGLFVELRERFASYTNFFTVDMNGDVVCTGIPDADPVNVLNIPWFVRAQNVEGFSVADYALGVVSRRPVITFSYPILDETGGRRYFLGTSLNLEWMNTFIATTDLPEGASLTAIDRNGTVLYRYPEMGEMIGQTHPNARLVAAVTTQQNGTLQDVALDGSGRLFGFATLDDNASAFVIVGLPAAAIFADSQAVLVRNLALLVFVGGTTLLLALYGLNRLVLQPVQMLVQNTSRLAAGDLDSRVDVTKIQNSRELGELGQSFNAMSDALKFAQEGLEAKVRDRTQDLTLIAEASRILATSLDYEATLKAVTELIVPQMADWCVIHLPDDAGLLQPVAIAHRDPARAAWLQEAHYRYPPPKEGDLYTLMKTGDALFTLNITDEMVKAAAHNEAHLQILREMELKATISAPLIVRGRALGVVTLVSSSQARHYDENTVKVVKELAQRMGTALDNASIYRNLFTQRQQLEVTLASIGDAVIAADTEGHITFINPVAEALTGWPASEAVGMRLNDVYKATGEQRDPDAPVLPETEDLIIPLPSRHLITREGREIAIDDTLTPIKDLQGNLDGTVVVFRDVTRRTLIEQERILLLETQTRYATMLRRSNESLQQFAYVASHDLQEPLRMVISYLQLLERRYAEALDQDAREFIAYAVDGASRMKELITGLLTYARLDTNEQHRTTLISLEEVMNRVLSSLSIAIAESGAVITHDPLPQVQADALQMTQLLQNLIGNALKFRGQEPLHVHVKAQSQGDEWLFSVCDNGIGIAPEYQERIFILFQRLHKRGEYSGTGIGLAICKKVIEQHNGRIWVESTAGQGACFCFTLPLKQPVEVV